MIKSYGVPAGATNTSLLQLAWLYVLRGCCSCYLNYLTQRQALWDIFLAVVLTVLYLTAKLLAFCTSQRGLLQSLRGQSGF